MLLLSIFLELLLSAVFGVASVAKLLDRTGTREATINFGVAPGLANIVATVLPLVELAVVVGLVFSMTAWASALTATLLLVGFSAAIGFNLKRGRTPDCHCFGQLYSRPLGWSTFIRNLVFAAGAGVVVWQGLRVPASGIRVLPRELGISTTAFVGAVLIVTAVIVSLVYWVRRRTGSRSEVAAPAASGLPLGSQAPLFALPKYHGGSTSLSELLDSGKPLVMIFSNPNCGPCVALFAEVAEWQKVYPEQLSVAVISQGTIKENFVNVARNDLRDVLLQREREVAEQYQASVTPTAVVVQTDGRIGSRVAAGADEIRALVEKLVGVSVRVGQSNSERHRESNVLIPRLPQSADSTTH